MVCGFYISLIQIAVYDRLIYFLSLATQIKSIRWWLEHKFQNCNGIKRITYIWWELYYKIRVQFVKLNVYWYFK